MTREKEAFIFSTYSHLFPAKEVRRDPKLSSLSYGIETEDGWFEIIEETCKLLSVYEGLKITQIKSKFGTLQIYTDFSNKEIDELLDGLSEKSDSICERCGSLKESKTQYEIDKKLYWFCLSCVEKVTGKPVQEIKKAEMIRVRLGSME